jgi:toxin ParE1/3/4
LAYRLSNAAAEDVAAIFVRGAAEFRLAQAEKYHSGLERIFEFLAANPRAARERDEFSPPARLHPFGVHVVVYRIVGEDVLVVRALHRAPEPEYAYGDAPIHEVEECFFEEN